MNCTISRGSARMVTISSTAPITASRIAEPSRASIPASMLWTNANPISAAISVAAITPMPPPCGVGTTCAERAFGRASA
jgi:hypothetical protein